LARRGLCGRWLLRRLVVGEIIAVVEVVVALTITGTALFGSQALSERAFRLLRWLGNRPEPPDAPCDSDAGQLYGVR
jgi:hypothetical protein